MSFLDEDLKKRNEEVRKTIREKARQNNSFVAYGDEQGRLFREYPVTGEIYEVSPGRRTLTLRSVHGVAVAPADQVVKPITDTAEDYIATHAAPTEKKAHFGFLVDVVETDFITRVQFVDTVETGSPEYEQLRGLGYDCTYSDGADPHAGILQNSIETKAQFIQLCQIMDPALAKKQGWS